MESNEREAKLKASSRQRATHGQMDDAYQPIRARALLALCYNFPWSVFFFFGGGGAFFFNQIQETLFPMYQKMEEVYKILISSGFIW